MKELKFNFIFYKGVVMIDKYTRLRDKARLKISQIQVELNQEKYKTKKLKRESNKKTDIIIRLNNIIRELKRENQNLPVALPVN